MTVFLILLVSVLVTSILSGIIGMAGGMILMAILVSVVPVANAMVLHGAVQATANGSRAWFLRKHIQWRILPPYLLGAGVALTAFWMLALVPDASVILILVGLFPWLGRLVPRLKGLDVTRVRTAAICGAVVTAAQLLAGASGPVLDVFYLNSQLNRYQVIASKALTQALGHVLKLIYYATLLTITETLPAWLYLAAIITAMAGTRLGTRLLDRIDEGRFRQVSGWIILAIATVCMLKGLHDLILE